MDHRRSEASELRFAAYVEELASVIGTRTVRPVRDYCMGLMLPGERKSVEPIAAVMAPSRVSAKHQSCCISSPTRRGRTSGFSTGCAN